MEDGSIRGESFQILIESFESASNAPFPISRK